MKMKYALIVLVAGALVTFGCKKVKDLLTFDMTYNQNFDIPGSIATNTPLTINTPNIPTNSSSTFDAKKTASNLIKTITLKEMKLQITAPDTGTYDFLKSVEIYINADGLSESKIAYKTSVAASPGDLINMDVSGDNLMSYIKKDNFSLKIVYQGDQTTTTSYTNKCSMVFEVSALPK